ncbi:MAG: hypothetical protein JWM98_1527 [Thermoleophilia bacterium]|nr:hypothetical protein [Thermoleophilia bacterium]
MTSTLDATTPRTGSTGDAGALTQAKDAALEKTEQARRKIGSQVSERVRDQADQHSTAIGGHVSKIAEVLQDASSSLRTSGEDAPAKAVDTITEHAENIGSYLSNVDGETLLHDLEDAARRRPWATAATLFGVGFAVSRVLGASSRSRYESRGGQTRQSLARTSGGYTPYPTTGGTVGAGSIGTGSTMGSGSTLTNGAANVPVGGVGNDSY